MTTNIYDEALKEICLLKVNLLKEVWESTGLDFGKTNNKIEYHNYLAENPIEFVENVGEDGGDFGDIPDNLTPSDTGLSHQMLNFISMKETGHPFGYKMGPKDLQGYKSLEGGKKTYGYGLKYHPNGKAAMQDIKPVWTQQELESLFLKSAALKVNKLKKWASDNGVNLNQHQIDAIVSGMYNFGDGFLRKPVMKMVAQNPNNPSIKNYWAHMSDSQGLRGLSIRRATEANWYFG